MEINTAAGRCNLSSWMKHGIVVEKQVTLTDCCSRMPPIGSDNENNNDKSAPIIRPPSLKGQVAMTTFQ